MPVAQTVELRALMSAPNSGRAWDLRCHVRERLIGFLQERYPDRLPKTRAEVRALNLREAPALGRLQARSTSGPAAGLRSRALRACHCSAGSSVSRNWTSPPASSATGRPSR